jgi:hypothetical protein
LLLVLAGCGQRQTQSPSAVELPAGIQIEVGLDRGLSTARDHVGDPFTATLGVAVPGLAAGSRVRGHITASHGSGADGRAALGITLDAVEVRGKTVPLQVQLLGGGAALDAILNGTGKGTNSSAPGQIEIPADTMFLFRLTEAVSVSP